MLDHADQRKRHRGISLALALHTGDQVAAHAVKLLLERGDPLPLLLRQAVTQMPQGVNPLVRRRELLLLELPEHVRVHELPEALLRIVRVHQAAHELNQVGNGMLEKSDEYVLLGTEVPIERRGSHSEAACDVRHACAFVPALAINFCRGPDDSPTDSLIAFGVVAFGGGSESLRFWWSRRRLDRRATFAGVLPGSDECCVALNLPPVCQT